MNSQRERHKLQIKQKIEKLQTELNYLNELDKLDSAHQEQMNKFSTAEENQDSIKSDR